MRRFVAILVLTTVGAACGQARAEENVMSGKPTAQDFIEALSPTRGIKPKDKAEAKPEVSLPTVHFAFDSAELAPDAKAVLDQLALALQSAQLGSSRFMIEGHTDSVGSDTYNQQLSERRALAVQQYLAAKQIDPTRLDAVGRGEAELLDPADSAAAVNRRVRVINLSGG